MDGKSFDGGKAEDYALTIGSHSFIDTFEEQLIGKNIGEECEVNVTFPRHLIVGGFDPLKYDTAGFLVDPCEKEDIVAVSVPCIRIPFSQGTADHVLQQLHLVYAVVLPSSFFLLPQGEEHQHRVQVMALPGPKQQAAVVNKAWICTVIRSRDNAFLKYGPGDISFPAHKIPVRYVPCLNAPFMFPFKQFQVFKTLLHLLRRGVL